MENQKNREAIAEFVRLFSSGDTAWTRFLAEDVVGNHWRWGAREVRGLSALNTEYFQPLRQAFPDLVFSVLDVIEGDRGVAMRGEFNATFSGKWLGITPHGRRVRWRAHDIYEFEGGKVVRIWLGNDTLTVARQLGSLPDDGRPW